MDFMENPPQDAAGAYIARRDGNILYRAGQRGANFMAKRSVGLAMFCVLMAGGGVLAQQAAAPLGPLGVPVRRHWRLE